MKAWHFLQENGQLRWKCGRTLKPKVGKTLKVDPDKLEMCNYGLHASVDIIDALSYAPGSVLCRVEMGGKILTDDDKCCASERTIVAMADASETLHLMAIWCAKRALKRADNPDPRSAAAIQAKEKWLKGEITDQELDAARTAAWTAARTAARTAAWDAWDAARTAACSAAWTTRTAAWAVARTAACSAEAAERKAQSRKLTKMARALLDCD